MLAARRSPGRRGLPRRSLSRPDTADVRRQVDCDQERVPFLERRAQTPPGRSRGHAPPRVGHRPGGCLAPRCGELLDLAAADWISVGPRGELVHLGGEPTGTSPTISTSVRAASPSARTPASLNCAETQLTSFPPRGMSYQRTLPLLAASFSSGESFLRSSATRTRTVSGVGSRGRREARRRRPCARPRRTQDNGPTARVAEQASAFAAATTLPPRRNRRTGARPSSIRIVPGGA